MLRVIWSGGLGRTDKGCRRRGRQHQFIYAITECRTTKAYIRAAKSSIFDGHKSRHRSSKMQDLFLFLGFERSHGSHGAVAGIVESVG